MKKYKYDGNIYVKLHELDKPFREQVKKKKTTISKLARSYIEQGLEREK